MFRFKQFTVIQENAAMKVCTDSCLFGALIGSGGATCALDIGTGTGLLSLMVAQRHPGLSVDAVEVDAGAAADAAQNFMNSPFRERLRLHEETIQDFARASRQTYGLVFCNPPFYEDRLKSPDRYKNIAHHATGLSFRELAATSARLLASEGVLWILLPPFEMERFIREAAENSLYMQERYAIRHNAAKPVFREIVVFSRSKPGNPAPREIIIYENDKYSSIFAELLRDYYLIF
ncbi:tRNA1(Val) (adenine(37)-N6)-methyltransferase [Leadbetterella sp. DM7]|uniref:tRNA1(Val) (adenine(37)-N6)-methyltransferase n=1 Tax=Leadbetterella sp. DM7 TaxID=3235085 RepID=UPI00349E4F4C